MTTLAMQRLPLFVLPTALLPGAYLPLHVFESRYRQMVARCLEFDRRFGLLFHCDEVYGPFRMEPGRIGCVAEIGDFRPLSEGRSVMVTRGIQRFRIADGVESDTQYHEALVEEYVDGEESEAELMVRRQRSIDLFESLLDALPGPPEATLRFDPRRETSFELAATFEIDPAWLQGLLELQRESERLDQVDTVLQAAIDSLRDSDQRFQ
jgi:Lon protease-like protein